MVNMFCVAAAGLHQLLVQIDQNLVASIAFQPRGCRLLNSPIPVAVGLSMVYQT